MTSSSPAAMCPKCKSTNVYRSHRRNWSDHLLCKLGGTVRRCRDCRDRHVGFQSLTLPLGIKQINAERVAGVALTLVLCGIAAWLLIRRLNLPTG